MLQRLYVDNYKCLVNFELSLEELTLLLGPNGTGKTAVLEVVSALRRILIDGAPITQANVFPTATLTRWQARDVQVFEYRVLVDDVAFDYRLEVEHERSSQRARIRLERLIGDGGPLYESRLGQVQLYRDDHAQGPTFSVDWAESTLARIAPGDDNRLLTRFVDFVRGILVCRLEPGRFVAESLKESAVLERDGGNFAEWYRHHVLEHTQLTVELTNTLRDVLAGFHDLRLERVGVDARALMVRFAESSDEYTLRFDELSEGQRALVVLYGLLHLTDGQGHVLFLDEPDNYVALPEIQPWLMALSDMAPPQAVLCSHHPELIDYLGGEDGLLLAREESGAITARRPDTAGLEGGTKLSEWIARRRPEGVARASSLFQSVSRASSAASVPIPDGGH